ncbi:hypothetical protein ACJX0J_007813, partial [Zea mays]
MAYYRLLKLSTSIYTIKDKRDLQIHPFLGLDIKKRKRDNLTFIGCMTLVHNKFLMSFLEQSVLLGEVYFYKSLCNRGMNELDNKDVHIISKGWGQSLDIASNDPNDDWHAASLDLHLLFPNEWPDVDVCAQRLPEAPNHVAVAEYMDTGMMIAPR